MNKEVYDLCKNVYAMTDRQAAVVAYKAMGVENKKIMSELQCSELSIFEAMRKAKQKAQALNSDTLFFKLGTKIG